MKTKVDGKEYVKKLYENIKFDQFYQNTVQTIFTQMISNFDEDPKKECLFLKIKGFSMKVTPHNGSWAEFYEVLKCDLSDHITKLDQQNMKERYFLSWKITKAIRVLQDHYIVHSDIKPGDILLDNINQPVIADFETIEFLCRDQSETESKGFTPRWASPELATNLKINFGTDVWSLGCLMLYIFTKKWPW
jgi:serine/threonine protein kinase